MADLAYDPQHDVVSGQQRAQTWRDSKAFKRFRRNPLAIVGLLVVFLFVCVVVLVAML